MTGFVAIRFFFPFFPPPLVAAVEAEVLDLSAAILMPYATKAHMFHQAHLDAFFTTVGTMAFTRCRW